jgi:hypothetical protein
MRHVIAIACTDHRGVIATDQGLPWHSKDELSYLFRTIEDQRVLMSHSVFRELSKKAKYRHATVITRNPEEHRSTGRVRYTDDAIKAVREMDLPHRSPLYVLGGPSIWTMLGEDLTGWDIGIWREPLSLDVNYQRDQTEIFHPFRNEFSRKSTMMGAVYQFLEVMPRWEMDTRQFQQLDLGVLDRVRLHKTVRETPHPIFSDGVELPPLYAR